ncbi:hypothetical protein D9619_009707 [Psilocybe cf. subviscida]|uniref:Uncharacterized protein n=1 Tax=Psilocybe cf. subviscida TaxID=2480587 RepID=A0A8H5BME4_9AGAR|nr:hypothetical protein D9619_009707 [Psilocybe cf. subviscida]
MLTKVTNRVRRRSLTEGGTIAYRIQAVTVAPDLLRWSDFANPFPPVALGGYSRYYASKTHSPPAGQESTYCPELSRHPDFASSTSSSSSKPSPTGVSGPSSLKTPLFPLSSKPEEPSTPPKRSLTIIREASRESMSPGSARAAGQSSLRRRRRQLLRTPSIERDFAVTARHLFSSSTSSLYPPSSDFTTPTKGTASPFPLHIRSISTGSDESHGSEDSHHTSSDESAQSEEYPITPTISMDSGEVRKGYGDTLVLGDTGEFDFGLDGIDANSTIPSLPTPKVEPVTPRPESWASFSTAKSDFGAA